VPETAAGGLIRCPPFIPAADTRGRPASAADPMGALLLGLGGGYKARTDPGIAWRGNVRELENVVQRAFMLSDGAITQIDPRRVPISTADFSPETNCEACFKEASVRALRDF
jgi:hypothetical protein